MFEWIVVSFWWMWENSAESFLLGTALLMAISWLSTMLENDKEYPARAVAGARIERKCLRIKRKSWLSRLFLFFWNHFPEKAYRYILQLALIPVTIIVLLVSAIGMIIPAIHFIVFAGSIILVALQSSPIFFSIVFCIALLIGIFWLLVPSEIREAYMSRVKFWVDKNAREIIVEE